MDEPLSNLDAQLRLQTRLELMDLHENLGITTIYVTHDQVEAMTMGNRMAVMRGGRIQQVGRPTDVYDFPANTFVARFLGAPPMNLLPGDLDYTEGRWWYRREGYELEIDAEAMDIPLDALEDATGQAWLGLRPEDLGLSPADHDGIPGTIRFLEPVGSDLYVSVEVAGGQPVQVRMPPRSPVKSGDSVRLKFAVTDSHLFAHHQQNLRKAPATARRKPVDRRLSMSVGRSLPDARCPILDAQKKVLTAPRTLWSSSTRGMARQRSNVAQGWEIPQPTMSPTARSKSGGTRM